MEHGVDDTSARRFVNLEEDLEQVSGPRSSGLEYVLLDLGPSAPGIRILQVVPFPAGQLILLPLRNGDFGIAASNAIPQVLNKLHPLRNRQRLKFLQCYTHARMVPPTLYTGNLIVRTERVPFQSVRDRSVGPVHGGPSPLAGGLRAEPPLFRVRLGLRLTLPPDRAAGLITLRHGLLQSGSRHPANAVQRSLAGNLPCDRSRRPSRQPRHATACS
jgi:hypothetical protein